MADVLKLPPLARDFDSSSIEVRKEDAKPTKLVFPASSEREVERWWGTEILSHEPKAIRLDRANKGAMPLLFNHRMDRPIGMVDRAWAQDGRLMVEAHLFETEEARNVATMIDGGLRNVSIGYELHVVEEDTKKQRFTARDWEPFEVSIVTVPADPSVGLGRALRGVDDTEREVRILRPSTQVTNPATTAVTKEPIMGDETAAAGVSAERSNGAAPAAVRIEAGQQQEQPGAVQMERDRRRAIETLCKANSLDDKYKDHWIRSGLSIDKVADDILVILEERGKSNPQSASKLGLTKSETQRFSLLRAIHACTEKDWSKAGFELECSRAVAAKLGRVNEPTKFFVPFEVLQREIVPAQQRDLTVGTAGAGGYLVSTDNMGFIEILRNRSVAFRMGARRLSGLQGNVTVPRQSAAATAVWLANEAATLTESQQTFVQMALTPKTVGAYTEVSRLLVLQSSPSAEAIVTDDLAQVAATAADLAVLNGSGASGQPTGILQTSGIGSVTGTSLAYAGVIEFQTDVATANVMPARGGYVTTPAVAGLLMQRARFSNTDTPLWEGNVWDGRVSGFPAMSSNQVPSATMIFGDWQEVVVGEWGVLEVEVNPYANFQAGIIGIRAMYTLDVGVRRPFAFSSASSIT